MPMNRHTHNISMEEKGYNCSNSTIYIKNVTKQILFFKVSEEVTIVKPGKKLFDIVPKGETVICYHLMEDKKPDADWEPGKPYCETIKLKPCIAYNFTPTLF